MRMISGLVLMELVPFVQPLLKEKSRSLLQAEGTIV